MSITLQPRRYERAGMATCGATAMKLLNGANVIVPQSNAPVTSSAFRNTIDLPLRAKITLDRGQNVPSQRQRFNPSTLLGSPRTDMHGSLPVGVLRQITTRPSPRLHASDPLARVAAEPRQRLRTGIF